MKKLIIAALGMILLAGCQTRPLEVHAIFDEQEFGMYQTVKVQTLTDDQRPKIEEVTKAIERHLVGKGYTLSEEAELVVLFDVTVEQGSELRLNDIPYKNNVVTRPTLEAVYEATLLVNAVDVARETVVWKALTTRDLREVNPKRVDAAKMDERMAEVFETFPAR